MKRELIISCIIHILLFLILGLKTREEDFTLDMAGDNVRVSIISVAKGNSSEDVAEKKSKREKKEEEKKETVTEEAPQKKEEKKIEKKQDKVKVADTPPIKNERLKKIQKSEVVPQKSEEVKEIMKDISSEEKQAEDVIEEKKEVVEAQVAVQGAEIPQKKGRVEGAEKDLGSFTKLSNGTLVVKYREGEEGTEQVERLFLSRSKPTYPTRAIKMGFKEKVTVKVILRFDDKGNLMDYNFGGKKDKYGFKNEVVKAIENWKANPKKYLRGQLELKFYYIVNFEVKENF